MAFVSPMAVRQSTFTSGVQHCCDLTNRHAAQRTPSTTATAPKTGRAFSQPRMVQYEVRRTVPKIDWNNLGFQYIQTACHVQSVWKDGEWSALQRVDEPYVRMHIANTALHYGQSCFEGLKAFRGRDGRVRIFRADENAKRMSSSAARLVIPNVPEQLFLEAVHTAVRENEQFVPPYGTGGSLYIRPILFGSGAKIGLQSSDEPKCYHRDKNLFRCPQESSLIILDKPSVNNRIGSLFIHLSVVNTWALFAANKSQEISFDGMWKGPQTDIYYIIYVPWV